MYRGLLLLSLALVPALAPSARGQLIEIPQLGLRVAPGFEIRLFAGHALAPDVYSMTLDPAGRVVISSRGYIKRLIDSDGDGRADRDEPIAKSGPGAMGLLFLDPTTLLAMEGGSLNRYRDADGDGQIDAEPERLANFAGGEHGAHAIRRDRQGRVWLIGGNDAKFRGNAIIDPAQRDLIEGGALLRFAEDLASAELVAHGFRNPYDFDFTSGGEIYCYDSDCEREQFLPWYSPTRLYQVEAGAHHGWRLGGWTRGWKRPDYYPDSVRPLVNVGRGSPTGVAAYRHRAFPVEYHDGVFYCDWTFGRVYFTQPDDAFGAPGGARAEIFIESMGTNGFAPTDIEVAPDGSLFISMGGRGTSGSVFHVRARAPRAGAAPTGAPAVHLPVLVNFPAAPAGFSAGRARALALALDAALLEDSSERRLQLIRELMVALGDWNLQAPSAEAFTGYELASAEVFDEQHAELLALCRNAPRELLHALDADERREAGRLLAMLRDPHPITASRLLDAITADSSPIDDFHYLACLARAASPLDQNLTARAAGALLALDGKVAGAQMRSKQTYTDRLNEVVAGLGGRAPIYRALLADPRLAAPNYAGVAAAFPAELRAPVAEAFLDTIVAAPDAGWREDAIDLLAPLPLSETRPLLRELAANPLLLRACARQLGREPHEEERALFLAAGELAALEKLPPRADAENLLPLLRATDGERALKLFARAAGRDFADRAAAEAWLRAGQPEIAKALGLGAPGARATDWPALFARVDWDSGEAERGANLFATRACATCHASANALGPNLSGVAQRLSPADLFVAIAQPNAQVPEAYRATVITMRDGTRHFGRIAFTAPEGRILQTAAGTLRLDENGIASAEDWARSLMPEGLLAGLAPGDLADLYAYLKTL